MHIIAVINQKGGVGKTTTTVNLGAALARLGKQVLLLDLDPQANLSLHLDRRPELEEATMTQLLVEDRPLAELIRPTGTKGLWVVAADTSLGGVEQVLANRIGRETILREAFESYRAEPRFDYVLIDCPPSLGVLSANALCAAGEVLIPMQTEYFSLQGMAKLTEVIQLVKRRLNPAIEIGCVLPCMVDLRTRLTGEVLDNIGTYFGDRLARAFIRSNVKLAEAPSFGATIFDHAPDSNGASDYWDFACEFLVRHGEQVAPERLEEARDAASAAAAAAVAAAREEARESAKARETGPSAGSGPTAEAGGEPATAAGEA
ncbi:MAG: ParA family protein [Planctomycetes bacterium]|nr:ParA family protein [Planctomycetota bacterium]